MRKRLLSLALCLILGLTLLPIGVLAAEDDTDAVLYVGGTNVSAGGYWKGDGNGGLSVGTATDYTVHYDVATSTLTLNGAEITAAYQEKNLCTYPSEEEVEGIESVVTYGIYSVGSGDLNLVLEGNNTITTPDLDPSDFENELNNDDCGVLLAFGIYVSEDEPELFTAYPGSDDRLLSISGNGSCLVTTGSIDGSDSIAKNIRVYGYGICADIITMKEGTLICSGGTLKVGENQSGESGSMGFGIAASKLTVESGKIEATGASIENQAGWENSYGIFAQDELAITGGSVTSIGGNILGTGYSHTSEGIHTVNLTVSNGTLQAAGGVLDYTPLEDSLGGSSVGITATAFTMENSSVSANGGLQFRGKNDTSCGFIVEREAMEDSSLQLISGTLHAQGGTSAIFHLLDDDPVILPDSYWWREHQSA